MRISFLLNCGFRLLSQAGTLGPAALIIAAGDAGTGIKKVFIFKSHRGI